MRRIKKWWWRNQGKPTVNDMHAIALNKYLWRNGDWKDGARLLEGCGCSLFLLHSRQIGSEQVIFE